jgi:hypothetical protein
MEGWTKKDPFVKLRVEFSGSMDRDTGSASSQQRSGKSEKPVEISGESKKTLQSSSEPEKPPHSSGESGIPLISSGEPGKPRVSSGESSRNTSGTLLIWLATHKLLAAVSNIFYYKLWFTSRYAGKCSGLEFDSFNIVVFVRNLPTKNPPYPGGEEDISNIQSSPLRSTLLQ